MKILVSWLFYVEEVGRRLVLEILIHAEENEQDYRDATREAEDSVFSIRDRSLQDVYSVTGRIKDAKATAIKDSIVEEAVKLRVCSS